MKNSAFWWGFAGGFLLAFLFLSILPNGLLFILGPFIGLYHIVELVFYVPFIIAVVLAFREKRGAYGWVLGSVLSVAVGAILFATIGFGFVPV